MARMVADMASIEGGCLCGAVRYRLAKPVTEIDACHCGMCRKFSGGIELGFNVEPGDVTWSGEDQVKVYRSSDWGERGFCGTCGSSLFWRTHGDAPAHLSLTGGSLDSFEGVSLTSEIFVDHKPDAYALAGERKRMTSQEVIAAFEAS